MYRQHSADLLLPVKHIKIVYGKITDVQRKTFLQQDDDIGNTIQSFIDLGGQQPTTVCVCFTCIMSIVLYKL